MREIARKIRRFLMIMFGQIEYGPGGYWVDTNVPWRKRILNALAIPAWFVYLYRASPFTELSRLRRGAYLRENQHELEVAHAAGSELGLFILHKIAGRDSMRTSELSANLVGPESLIAFARLIKAGLLDESGEFVYVTPSGRQVLAEIMDYVEFLKAAS